MESNDTKEQDFQIIKRDLMNYFKQNSPIPSAVDLLFTGKKEKYNFFEFLTNIILMTRRSDNKQPYFSKIIFILPNSSIDFDINQYENNLNFTLRERNENTTVCLLQLEKLDSNSLIDTLNLQSEFSAIIISSIEKFYHHENLIDVYTNPTGDFRVVSGVDHLYQSIADISIYLSNFVSEKNIYLILDSELNTPHDYENYISKLENVNNLGITGFGANEEQRSKIDKMNNSLILAVNHIKKNEIGIAFKIIDANPYISEKDLVKLQLLHEANIINNFNLSPHITNFLKKIEFKIDELDCEAALKLAKIASSAGNIKYSKLFLIKVFENSNSLFELEGALDIANKVSDYELASQITQKLKKTYPTSKKIIYLDALKLIEQESYEEAGNFLIRNSLNIELAHIILRFKLALNEENFDYLKFLSNEEINFRDSLYLVPKIITNHALNHDQLHAAYGIIKSIENKIKDLSFTSTKLLLIKKLFFQNKKLNDDKLNFIIELMNDITSVLFKIPEDQVAREDFIEALDWSNTDYSGVVILGKITYEKLIHSNITIKKYNAFHYSESDSYLEKYTDIYIKCMDFFENQAILVSGKHLVPRSNFPESAEEIDKFIIFLTNASKHLIKNNFSENDINIIHIHIAIIISAAPYSTNTDCDIDCLKDISSLLTEAGFRQVSRDYAEQILQISEKSKSRLSKGWLAVSEIYQRQGKNISAIFYIKCALENNSFTSVDFFYLTTIMIRAYRDIGMLSEAKNISKFSIAKLLEFDQKIYFENKPIYDFLNITITYKKLSKDKSRLTEETPRLIKTATEFAENEIKHQREPKPIATILMQLVNFAIANNIPIPTNTIDIINSICFSTKDFILNKFYDFYMNGNIDSLLTLYKSVNETRYASDAAYDFSMSRKLAADYLTYSPHCSIFNDFFALEMLTDHSLPSEDSMSSDKPIALYNNINEPLHTAQEMATAHKVAFLLLGLNGQHQLVIGLCDSQGKAVITIETETNFLIEKLSAWQLKYPREYDNDDPNHNFDFVYESMSGIGIDIALETEIIFILDTEIHSLTPKLLNYKENFLGYHCPALAITPSIAWLNNKMTNPQLTNGHLKCWISNEIPPSSDESFLPLQIMADNFQDSRVFENFNIHFNQENTLPRDFKNSELVIIGAHGGVTDRLHTFRSVSDEANLRERYQEVAKHLTNCGVVILFVCSSGRFNSHPEAKTTISFAKELIKNGCSAVIASPWPLDVTFTSHWLSNFLENWIAAGDTVNQAVSKANILIAQRYSYDPLKYLALTIYGNPLRKYQNS